MTQAKTSIRFLATAAAMAMLMGTTCVAQLPIGRLNTVFPAGGQRGTTFPVKLVNFADLDEAQVMRFSHRGIRAVPKKQSVEGSTEFIVSIDPSVPDGWYEVRAGGLFGLSNPRGFMVGSLRELVEAEPNNTPEKANALSINSTANGTISGRGDVDWYGFQGKAGQRVLIECAARAVDSRLAAVIEVFDSNRKRISRARDTGVGDLLCDVTLQADTTHFVRVADAAFRGSNENVYRLSVHTAPHIDFVLPAAVRPGRQQPVAVYGRNLPGGRDSGVTVGGQRLQKLSTNIIAPNDSEALDVARRITAAQSDIDGFSWRLAGSNTTHLHYAIAAPTVESEPNNDAGTAGVVSIPADVTGQFQTRGDVDVFRFKANAKQVVMIEAFGGRNGTTADPYVEVALVKTDSQGKETIARQTAQDDIGTNIGGNDFFTANGDTAFRFTCLVEGTYQLSIRDRYFDSRGDPSLVYRLVVREPQPDFRLIALPSKPGNAAGQPLDSGSIAIRRGGSVEVPVLVHRRDGHAEAIQVQVENLPSGVTASPLTVLPGQRRATLILQARADAEISNTSIRVIGESNSVRRFARAATIVRRGGAASESRLSQDLVLCVLKGMAPLRLAATMAEIHANQSQQLLIPIQAFKANGFDADIPVTFEGAPKNAQVANVPIKKGQATGTQRLFLTPTTPVGTHVVLARGAATVPFVRNPWRLHRQQAAHAGLVKAEASASQAVAAAKAKLNAANGNVAKVQAANEKAKAAAAGLPAQLADVSKSTAANAEKQKGINATIVRLRKQFQARQAAAKALVGPVLAEQRVAADKLVAATSGSMAAANKSLAELIKASETLMKKRTELMVAKKRLKQEIAAYPGLLDTAMEAVATAKAELKELEPKLAAASAAKAAADKQLAAVKNQTKPQSIKIYEPAAPILIHVAAAPLTLKADASKAAEIKAGQSAEISVTVAGDARGSARLSLVGLNLPSGLRVEPVELPATISKCKLIVNVAANTPPGALAYACVRATTEKGGRTYHVDAPVKIAVVK